MSRKRPLEVVTPEAAQQAAAAAPGTPLSPSKRLRRAGLVMMWLRRRPRPIAVEQMAAVLIQQMQVEMVKMFMLLMVLVVRLGTVERLLLEQPSLLQRLFEERFAAFQRSFMGAIQDMIRTSVHSEVHERQATLLSKAAYQHPRSNISEGLPQTEGGTKIVKLLFVDVERPEDPLFTGSPVKWQNGANAKVAIFENGSKITQGDLSKLQIEILAVHDDFFTERGPEDFTKEEFNRQIYLCKGKESVLTTVNLTNGEAYIGSFFFTESSYGKKLRLAARIKCQDLAVRVQEATSHSFVVKHCRSKSNKKSYTPSKEEGVHCLKKIAPKGKHYNYLKGKNITKVKHLMRHYHRDQAGLRKLTGMKNEEWNTMIKHAATSDPGDEIYSYSVPEENVVLFFNDFFDLTGMSIGGFYTPYNANKLDQLQQRKVNNWKRSAHKKFEDQEKLGSLIPDYAMSNGLPVLVSPNDASPSIQARPTCQCSDYQRALQEFGQTHRYNDAGPSTQGKQLLQQYAYGQNMHRESGQQDPSLQLNENSNHLKQGNILIDQSSIPAQLNTPSHNTLAVQEDDLITGANPSVRHNGNLSSLTTDAAGTSHPVTDGAIRQNLMNEYGQIDEVFVGLSPIGEWVEQDHGHIAYQGFLPDNNETASSNNQFHGHEYDGGNDDNLL